MPIPTLPDVKDQLGITGSSEDALLALYLKAALALVEDRVGPSTIKTFTETVDTHGNAILLSKRPVTEIVSIEPQLDTWPTHAVGQITFDGKAGVIWRKDLGSLAGNYIITYKAGWTPAEWRENWTTAVLVTVQQHWRTQRGSSRRPSQGGADALSHRSTEPSALPPLAEELISDGPYYGGIC